MRWTGRKREADELLGLGGKSDARASKICEHEASTIYEASFCAIDNAVVK